ncbi:MAG: alpha/beta hydrolase [Oscillospiraceae bacterium]|nr:alpha/beta hydrolase [Oscillospiraceae bacterium]
MEDERLSRFAEAFRSANEYVLDPGRFTKETFDPYNSLVTLITLEVEFYDFPREGDVVQKQLDELEELRKKLVPDESSIRAWDIWGDKVPTYGEVGSFELTYTNPDFRPLLVPYLCEDQDEVKGNIIAIAGGGYVMRCNAYEGFNIAEYYRDHGYNAYVLQRRITPYHPVNAHLDLQRAIRFLRANAKKYGIGNTDHIAAVGFSGGGATIYGTMMSHYGHILPDQFDPSYCPDDVDSTDSDLQAALFIYGTGRSIKGTDNCNIPPAFMVTGEMDEYHADVDSVTRYMEMKEAGINAELHIFSDQHHGFGLGDGNCDSMRSEPHRIPGVEEWPGMSLAFLERTFS